MMRIKERDEETGRIKDDFVDLPVELTLELAKSRKIAELKDVEDNALSTFKSSALGSEYTYLSGLSDMLLLAGEYAFVKGSDYNGTDPIYWYTVESGNMIHSGAQFIQIYLDARANVQTVKYHRSGLDAQVNAATTIEQVSAIVW